MQAGAVYTPRPRNVGILRSPHTPGTGSSVRFGMRTYEDGEESLLTASVSSAAEHSDSQDVSLGLSSDSMDMSFPESFLRREVDEALAGLDDSPSVPSAPYTPARTLDQEMGAPSTLRPSKNASVLDDESTSPPDSPPAHVGAWHTSPDPASTSPLLSSPTIRAADRRPPPPSTPSDTSVSSPVPSSSSSSPPPPPPPPSYPEEPNEAEAPDAEPPTASPEIPHEEETSQASMPAMENAPGPSTPVSQVTRPRATPSRTDSSFASSGTTWATPQSHAGSQATTRSPKSPSHWPGMYEYSYMTDKDELDDKDTGTLVPFAMEELSSKLLSTSTLGDVDATELMDMIAALDRTHTERTIFLQHRLARSHRLTQVLRDALQQAQDKIHVFEEHLQTFLKRKAQLEMEQSDTMHAELRTLTEQLEARLATLHGPLLIEPAQTSSTAALAHVRAALDAERETLEREKQQLAIERRDLEVRLATPVSTSLDVDIQSIREACQQDAEVRVLMARQEAAEEIRALQVQLAEAQTAPSEGEAWQARCKDLETQLEAVRGTLEKTTVSDDAWMRERQALVEARTRAEVQLDTCRLEWETKLEEATQHYETLHDEYTQQQRAWQAQQDEREATWKAERHTLQQRIWSLERDVAAREMELQHTQAQRDTLEKETQHFSLALYV
ncbi:hypothetical protein ACI68E_001300 [Malassezia pachydermatis]